MKKAIANPIHEAAAVPYGTNEDSVIYHSTDWSELTKLLQNPVVFLGSKGMMNSVLPWSLKGDTTVLIEPFNASAFTTLRFVGIVKPELLRAAFLANEDAKSGSKKDITDVQLQRIAAAVIEHLIVDVPDGQFVAEFALNTGALCIRYQVPTNLLNPLPDEPTSCGHFKGKHTKATYIGIGAMENQTSLIGNVHFDIKFDPKSTKPDLDPRRKEIHRGTMILDMIENPHRIFSRLGTSFRTDASFVGVHEGLPDLKSDYTASDMPQPTYTFTTVRPTILVEKMSPTDLPSPCGVCVDGQTVNNGNGTWTIGGVIYKCYAPAM